MRSQASTAAWLSPTKRSRGVSSSGATSTSSPQATGTETSPEMELLDGRYEIVRTISEGRRASVFEALDHDLDKPVALKIYAVDDARGDVPSEVRLLMQIEPHPALPAVRGGFRTDDGRYALALSWVDGTDLQELVDTDGRPGLP